MSARFAQLVLWDGGDRPVVRRLYLGIGLALSFVCLWLAIGNIQLADLGSAMAGGSYLLLIPAVVLQLLAIAARSMRWVDLLGGQARFWDAFWAQNIGYMFTNLLPFRLGEPARVVVMSRNGGLPVVEVAASAIVERLMDVATVVAMLVTVLPFMQVPPMVAGAGLAFGVLALMALVALLAMARFGTAAEAFLLSICRFAPGSWSGTIASRWKELVAGLSPLSHPPTACRVVAWSIAIWGLSAGVYWFVIRAYRPDGNLLEATFMLIALVLAITMPSSPGFIGVFQLVGQQALVIPFAPKYDPTSALAITVAVHAVYYVLTTLLGLRGLWHFGQSFASLTQSVTPRRRSSDPLCGQQDLDWRAFH